MLRVKTHLEPVPGKGIGLFADEPIAKGAVWWRDDPAFDRTFSAEQFIAAPVVMQLFLRHYATAKSDGSWYLYVDNARFVNHSDDPNTAQANGGSLSIEGDWVATRNIEIGEEITSDYRTFCVLGVNFDNQE
jgi:SET domain-containing protein